jgi:hypothetical protein
MTRLLVLLVMLVCTSCADEPGTCTYTHEIVSLDDTSALGFSAADEQRAIVGTWIGELTYLGGGEKATVTPNSGQTRVVFEWKAIGSGARYVHGRAPAGQRLGCDAYLETDMELRFVTDDHAFDEVIELVFRHDGGPKRGTIIDVSTHDFAGFQAGLVAPEQFEEHGSDLWLTMEGNSASGFINVWAAEQPQTHADGTTTGGGPAPRVVSFSAQR